MPFLFVCIDSFCFCIRIDDVEDDSVLRRGAPAAHHIYGIPQTINCANYVYFLALAEISTLNKPKMITIYTEELINLHRGQGKSILSFFFLCANVFIVC